MMDQDVFQTDRPLLFSVAYRMLGSASDAEDVLQDAWVRYCGADRAAIRSPKAFATTIVTRLCLDRLKSARATREEYIGPWLPEPVLTSGSDSPESAFQRAESLTLAFLVLLEQLSPQERAVFVLKDVFEYDHAEIGGMLGISGEYSRQLLHRARGRLVQNRPVLESTDQSRRPVAERFARAFAAGNANELSTLLAGDAGLWSDGGGKVAAARRPLAGRDEVVNFLVGIHRVAEASGSIHEASLALANINCEPALLVSVRGHLESVFVLSIFDHTIAGVRVIRNPDKLIHLKRQLVEQQLSLALGLSSPAESS